MLCTGNSLEYCGAGNRLSLYMYNATLASLTSSVASFSTSSTKISSSTVVSTTSNVISSTTSSTSPKATGINGYAYVGCQTDPGADDRTLGSTSFTDTLMTVETCSSFCGTRGYTYFGVEYSTECEVFRSFLSHNIPNFDTRLLWQHVRYLYISHRRTLQHGLRRQCNRNLRWSKWSLFIFIICCVAIAYGIPITTSIQLRWLPKRQYDRKDLVPTSCD